MKPGDQKLSAANKLGIIAIVCVGVWAIVICLIFLR